MLRAFLCVAHDALDGSGCGKNGKELAPGSSGVPPLFCKCGFQRSYGRIFGKCGFCRGYKSIVLVLIVKGLARVRRSCGSNGASQLKITYIYSIGLQVYLIVKTNRMHKKRRRIVK